MDRLLVSVCAYWQTWRHLSSEVSHQQCTVACLRLVCKHTHTNTLKEHRRELSVCIRVPAADEGEPQALGIMVVLWYSYTYKQTRPLTYYTEATVTVSWVLLYSQPCEQLQSRIWKMLTCHLAHTQNVDLQGLKKSFYIYVGFRADMWQFPPAGYSIFPQSDLHTINILNTYRTWITKQAPDVK